MKRQVLGACVLFGLFLSLDGGGAEAQPGSFAACWASVEGSKDAAASMACLARAPAAVRTSAEFACYEAIAFALSHSRVAADYRHGACVRHFHPQPVPQRIATLYDYATGLAPQVVIGRGGQSGGFVLIPVGAGGMVNGLCAPGARCDAAVGALVRAIGGEDIDRAALQPLFASVRPQLSLSCNSTALCATYQRAIETLAEGTASESQWTGIVGQLRREQAVAEEWRCGDPATCSRLESMRERSLRPADVQWLQQRYREGVLRCLGEGCREPAMRLEAPSALTPAQQRELLQQLAPSLDARGGGPGSMQGGGDR